LTNKVNNLSIDIFDKLGRLINDDIIVDSNLDVKSKNYRIDTSTLPEGIYNVKVNIDDSYIFKKMIVIKN